jgi:hypothetical protein
VGKTQDNRYEVVQRFGKFSPYSLAYEVDVTDHHDVVEEGLPSRGDVFYFRLRLVLDWRVTDPVTVVARGIREGLPRCTAYLLDQMRHITRQFPIEASADAEVEIRRAVGPGPVVLPEGITIHQIRPQLTLDEATRNAGHARAAAEHDGSLAVIKGRTAVAAAHHESNIMNIQQQGELARRQQSLEAIQSALSGNYDPIALHLAQHPEQTGELINMIRTDVRENEQRRDGLIRELIQKGLIQDIDVGDLTSSLLNNAASAYQFGPQRTIGGPQVVQGAVTGHHIPAPPDAAQPAQNSAGTTTDQPADNSGVAGWRRLPPAAD